MNFALHHGDCIEVMRAMANASVDSIVTDPPYELGFMGKAWDASGIANSVAMWAEALRVLKPGGHLLAFSGSRTYHRMVCAIEDAGFEVRDQIMWVYGSGFPKSMDVSKAIDKAAGAVREVVGYDASRARPNKEGFAKVTSAAERQGNEGHKDNGATVTAPSTEEAREWEGWGTALKPAHEPICIARKPLAASTVAANVLQFGTGAINIDGCRVTGAEKPVPFGKPTAAEGWRLNQRETDWQPSDIGRWPANLIHDGSPEVLAAFPESNGQQGDVRGTEPSGVTNGIYGEFAGRVASPARGDTGSAARFFYCAKASRSDRNEGCADLPQRTGGMVSNTSGQHMTRRDEAYEAKPLGNFHPTVKPTDLMAYLCRLVTPPGGTVLDPFMGSGSTGKACMREGFDFIGIDMTAEYVEIARARIQVESQKTAEITALPKNFDLFPEAA